MRNEAYPVLRYAHLLAIFALLAGCASHEAPACRGDTFDLNPAAGTPR